MKTKANVRRQQQTDELLELLLPAYEWRDLVGRPMGAREERW